MPIELSTPGINELAALTRTLGSWQYEGAPMQLHPGDVGWHWRLGAEVTAAAVRVWSRDGEPLAIGLADGTALLRMTLAPAARRDEALAGQLLADLTDPGRGVLGEGRVAVEAPADALLHELLARAGWELDEPWSPLALDLTGPVDDPGRTVEVVGPEQANDWSAVVRASFGVTVDTDHRWPVMAAGAAFADARCLLIRDGGAPAAAVAVWSAGPGRPGLLEPMGVHPDLRHRGHGRAICLAAAVALRELGASSAIVCTPSANVGGVAAYRSAGYTLLPQVRDRYRPV